MPRRLADQQGVCQRCSARSWHPLTSGWHYDEHTTLWLCSDCAAATMYLFRDGDDARDGMVLRGQFIDDVDAGEADVTRKSHGGVK
jgi:hypothetical protein